MTHSFLLNHIRGFMNTECITSEELTVYFDDKPMYKLNKNLFDRQDCWENLEKIKEAHWLKLLFYNMIENTPIKNTTKLKELANDITECEFYLQELWKLNKNQLFHRFWETPLCECPKMDNSDAWPTGYYIKALNCPLHGN